MLFFFLAVPLLFYAILGCSHKKKKSEESAPNTTRSKASSEWERTVKESEQSTKKVESKKGDTLKSWKESKKPSEEKAEKKQEKKKEESPSTRKSKEESTKKKSKRTEETTKREESTADDGWMFMDPTKDRRTSIRSTVNVHHKYANEDLNVKEYMAGAATEGEAEKICLNKNLDLVLYYKTTEEEMPDLAELWMARRQLDRSFLHNRVKKCNYYSMGSVFEGWQLIGSEGFYDKLSTLVNFYLTFPYVMVNGTSSPRDD